jgi:hypothetical protein
MNAALFLGDLHPDSANKLSIGVFSHLELGHTFR